MSCVQFRHHKLQRELHNHWPAVKSLWIISLFLPFSLTPGLALNSVWYCVQATGAQRVYFFHSIFTHDTFYIVQQFLTCIIFNICQKKNKTNKKTHITYSIPMVHPLCWDWENWSLYWGDLCASHVLHSSHRARWGSLNDVHCFSEGIFQNLRRLFHPSGLKDKWRFARDPIPMVSDIEASGMFSTSGATVKQRSEEK